MGRFVAVVSVCALLFIAGYAIFQPHDLIVAANFAAATTAVVALTCAGRHGVREVRGWAFTAVPTAVYFAGLNGARLYAGPLPDYMTDVTRGVALTAWVTVWIGLPLATIRTRRRNRAALEEFQIQVSELLELKLTSTTLSIRHRLPPVD